MPDMPIWFSNHSDSRLEVPFGFPYTERMKNKKAPIVLTKDQIANHIIASITDFDTGWASTSNVASNGTKTEFILQANFWNTVDTKFKITIEEA